MYIKLEIKNIDTAYKRIIFSYLPIPTEAGINSVDLWAVKIKFEGSQYYDMNYTPYWMEIWCVGHRCFYGNPYQRFDCLEAIDRLLPYASFDVYLYFDDRCEFNESIVSKFYLELFDQCRNKIEVR
jgi:hypothetical protein